ncbi:MAG: hypothetical protein ACTHOB_15835 [Ginsengibacter sp.]|jgi:hypothetical protein
MKILLAILFISLAFKEQAQNDIGIYKNNFQQVVNAHAALLMCISPE